MGKYQKLSLRWMSSLPFVLIVRNIKWQSFRVQNPNPHPLTHIHRQYKLSLNVFTGIHSHAFTPSHTYLYAIVHSHIHISTNNTHSYTHIHIYTYSHPKACSLDTCTSPLKTQFIYLFNFLTSIYWSIVQWKWQIDSRG